MKRRKKGKRKKQTRSQGERKGRSRDGRPAAEQRSRCGAEMLTKKKKKKKVRQTLE